MGSNLRIDATLQAQLLSAFAPPPKTNIVEWCESNIRLPSTTAEPGPLKFTAYQRGLVEAFADPDCEIMALCLASQTGKSSTLDSAMLWTIANAPGPSLLVHPSEGKATDYVKNRLDPLIESTKSIKELIGQGARTSGGSSIRHKVYPAGSISIGSSWNPDDLAARSIRYLYLDECDRFARSAGSEGDPVQLAIKRTRTFANRKIVISSTPTAKNSSRIAEWFMRGTQERFFAPCPECGTFDVYRFEDLKWTAGQPTSARIVCSHCGHHTTEPERLAAIELGVWQATNDTPEKSIRSFHATELVSKFSTLESVARQYEEAEKQPEKLRVFFNTVLAEAYDFGEEQSLDASELQQRAEFIPSLLPNEITKICAGVDVQAARLECTLVGFSDDNRAFVLQHSKLMGDTAGSVPWEQLDDLLGATFTTQDRRVLPIASAAIDSGFNTSFVAQFVSQQRRKNRNVIAIKGVGGFDKPTIRKGALLRGLTQLYLVGVDGVKASIQKRLAMQEVGPGFIHLNEVLEPAYFEGLTVETLRTRFVRGYAKLEFHNSAKGAGGVGNEPMDCLCYSISVASITKARVAEKASDKPSLSIAEFGERLNNPKSRIA
jgi:phage terminase large subunit GpA-like protein